MRARRHVRRPPDLTSLFDVLFIVVFAALIRAAAVENAAAHPPAPPRPRAPETPPEVAALRQRALSELQAGFAGLAPLVVRVTRDGTIDGLDVDGARVRLVVPLLERDPSPDVRLRYGGDRNADLRVCRIAARQLGTAELPRYLVIVAPAVPLDDLPQALYLGLRRDLEHCRSDQRAAAAVLVDPAALQPIAPAPTPQPTQPPPPRTTP